SGTWLFHEDLFDKTLEHEIGAVQEDADDQTGDQHDDDALDQLILAGPFDLLQLAPRLGDEAPRATAGEGSRLAARLTSRRRLRSRARRRPSRRCGRPARERCLARSHL